MIVTEEMIYSLRPCRRYTDAGHPAYFDLSQACPFQIQHLANFEFHAIVPAEHRFWLGVRLLSEATAVRFARMVALEVVEDWPDAPETVRTFLQGGTEGQDALRDLPSDSALFTRRKECAVAAAREAIHGAVGLRFPTDAARFAAFSAADLREDWALSFRRYTVLIVELIQNGGRI